MKHIAFKSLMIGAALATTLSACDENSWNDEYLEGFDAPTITKKETVVYTMTAADIKKMAGMPANKAIARERGEVAQLESVGANGFFTAEITPEYYAPAWLDSLSGVKGSFNYYLSEKSTIQLNFPTSDALPAELTGIQSGVQYTVSEADYQTVWGSETDFVEAFAPSKPAAKAIPGILDEAISDPETGLFAIVTYNVASQDPVFGGGSSTTEPEPEDPDDPSIINSVAKTKALTDGTEFDVQYAMTVGFVSNKNIFACDATGDFIQIYASNSYAVGDVIPAGWTGTYKLYNGVTPEIEATEVPAATPGTFTAKEISVAQALDINTVNTVGLIKNVTFSDATPSEKVNFSGKVGDTELSFRNNYTKPGVDAGTYDVTVVVTVYNGATSLYIVSYDTPAANAKIASRAVNVVSKQEKAAYTYNGSAWTACQNVLVLNADDYAQMTGYSNLSAEQASTLLPIYLSNKYPYAKEGAEYFIVYNLKDGSNTITNFTSRATFTGTEWSVTTINNDMMQFVRAGKGDGWSNWVYDPSVYIDLPAGKNSPSAPFWQACVDWVYEHVDVPEFGAESITSGIGYVTSYGNNDYYTGASAYQGNIDLRPGSARNQVPSVYGEMSDDDIVALMKERFEEEVCPAVLAQSYPDAQPGKGVDLYYVISFVMYNGSSHDEVIRYLVTAPGTFTFVDCTWNEE